MLYGQLQVIALCTPIGCKIEFQVQTSQTSVLSDILCESLEVKHDIRIATTNPSNHQKKFSFTGILQVCIRVSIPDRLKQ